MGWYYTYGASKKRIIEEICEGWKNEATGSGNVILKKCVRGNVLWTLNEVTGADGTKTKLIGCHLIGSSDGDWGYKPMDESMGPCYWSCPEEYLNEAPVVNENWRKGVAAYHERRRKRSVRKGDRAQLVHTSIERLNGMFVTIEGRRRSKVMARASDGTLLLVPPACLERVA